MAYYPPEQAFSAVYIGGTALALSFTMLYGMIFYIKLAPFYPEYERNRTAYIETVVLTSKDSYDNWHQANLSLNFVRTWFYNLKSADKVSAQYNEYSGGKTKDVDGQNISVALKLTDPTFLRYTGLTLPMASHSAGQTLTAV